MILTRLGLYEEVRSSNRPLRLRSYRLLQRRALRHRYRVAGGSAGFCRCLTIKGGGGEGYDRELREVFWGKMGREVVRTKRRRLRGLGKEEEEPRTPPSTSGPVLSQPWFQAITRKMMLMKKEVCARRCCQSPSVKLLLEEREREREMCTLVGGIAYRIGSYADISP
ncbi:uncharacterized protein LOC130781159 [Actinidia eriantha]|uniref:uncharacterized protein LOC130781159 n=1 Tax=Actinidia eriantha TaxID=165200 RepID=UPI002583BE39|nr:uncharacterized protein LOC130781159 [Actinidia eriantha]